MAKRNLPYLKLYVQDFLSDEKLNECSAEATGVYIRLMCIMHKTEEYGTVRLKAKDKHGKPVADLAKKLSRQMPYDSKTIERSLEELLEEGVLTLEGDLLYQKRMVHDGKISAARSAASQQRWRADNTSSDGFVDSFGCSFGYAKPDANAYPNSDANSSTNTDAKSYPNDDAKADAKQEQQGMQKCDYDYDPEYMLHLQDYLPGISSLNKNNNLPNRDITITRAPAQEEAPQEDGDPELAKVFRLYLDEIDSSPTPTCIELLKGYVEELGGDVVVHAINEARDQGIKRWSYIREILKGYASDGVRSLADIQQRERDFERRKRKGGNDNAQRDISRADDPDIVYAVDGREPGTA